MPEGRDGLEIRPVRSSAEFRLFVEAAFAAQGADPNWVPPLVFDLARELDPGRNPFLRENETQAWVALRCGRPAGRIVAVRNAAHLARHRDGTGHFGFLEGVDDIAVFAGLVDTAASWLRARGLTRLAGPFSLSINHEAGLLVEGFAHPPCVRMGHAQPWYARHLAALGFRPAKDLLAYRLALAGETFTPRFERALARWPGRGRLSLRPLSQLRYREGILRMLDLFNDAWSENWGFVPVGPAESAFIARVMRPLVRPGWVSLACWDGEPIALAAQIPDLNEAARDLGGRLLPFGWAKLAWRLALRGPRRSRIPLFGLRRAFHGTRPGQMAVSALLARSIARARAAGVESIEISWVLEDNRPMVQLMEGLGAERYKTYRVFARDLQR